MIEYRQKSKLFLFPLLGIPNSAAFKPTNTYLADENKGIGVQDCRLIVCYDKKHAERNKEYYANFESKMLIGNKMFTEMYDSEDCIFYVFDMSKYKTDYGRVVRGEYSQMSEKIKLHIDKYHTSHIGPNAHIRRYLFVNEKAYEFFATELGVTKEALEEVGELCSPADIDKETLAIKLDNLFV